MITIDDIRAAQKRIANGVQRTPMPRSDALSDQCDCHVYVKLENLQRTGSFKERGALNKLLQLSPAERLLGVVAASAGNHAQGVAYHARRLGIQATIVMPENSPLVKVRSTRDFGAEVILFGENYDAAYVHAQKIKNEQNRILIHAFDDPEIIAGQGTVGLEIIEEFPTVDAVIIPIGGGGLISGSACAIKTLHPNVRVIGVNIAASPAMKRAIEVGHIIELPAGRTICEGISVRQVGELSFAMTKRFVDDIVTVDDEEVANAILQLLEKEKTVAEGAGAAPMAALLYRSLELAGKNVVICLSGGNINVNLISRIIERGLIKDGRRVQLKVVIPDRPGMLADLLAHVAQASANVLEVQHQRWSRRLTLNETEVSLVLETQGRDHVDSLIQQLEKAGLVASEVEV